MVERQLRRRGIADERVLAAMARGPARALRRRAARAPRLRRLGAADRRRADDLAALDRRRDLPGAGARAATSGCSRSAPAPATRPRSSPGSRPRCSASSASTSLAARGRERLGELGCDERRGLGSATAASGRPSDAPVRRDRGPRDGAGAAAERCSRSSPPGGRLVIPVAEPAAPTCCTVFDRTTGGGLERRGDRALPVRAAGRRAGLRRATDSRLALAAWPAASTRSTSSRPRSSTSSSAVARRRRSGSATSRASTSAASSLWVTVGHQHSPREKIFTAVIDDVEVKKARELSPRDIEHDNPEFRRRRGDARLHAPDLRPRDRPRRDRHRGPLLAGARAAAAASATARRLAQLGGSSVPVEYRFLTTWLLESPREPVWDAIYDQKAWPAWWRGVEDVVELEPGDETGVGSHSRLTWRSKLPYDLVFEATTAHGREAAPDRGRCVRRAHRQRPLAAVRAGRGDRGALRVERRDDEAVDERARAAAAARCSSGTTTG